MRFEFTAPNRIIFGPGTLQEVGPIAASLGKRVFIVSGVPENLEKTITSLLEKHSLSIKKYSMLTEPSVEMVRRAVLQAKGEACEVVIGFGGGSAIDTAKAVSAMLSNPGNLLDYLEVIGRGQILAQLAAPCIAIPTTAGTGAEITRNAVLSVPEAKIKVSLRSHTMLPRLAVVDPELTYQLPSSITASTGLDALTQVIEPYVSVKANPLTDAFCVEGIRRAGKSLRRAYEHGDDVDAREDMCMTSLYGGFALANAGLGIVHGIASVLGGMFNIPHGVVCARLLPICVEINLRALQHRQPDHPSLVKYDEIAKLLTGSTNAFATDGVKWICDTTIALNIQPFRNYGVTKEYFSEIIEKSSRASSTKANPISLTKAEMVEILEKAV